MKIPQTFGARIGSWLSDVAGSAGDLFLPSVTVDREDLRIYGDISERYLEGLRSDASVIYPYCGVDQTPAGIFPRTKFIDSNARNVRTLRRAGADAILCDPLQYREGSGANLVLAQQSPADLFNLSRVLSPREGGYMLCGNSFGAADMFAQRNSSFKIVEQFVRRDGREYQLFRRL